MKLIQSGKKGLWCSLFTNIVKNCKMELVFGICGIMWIAFSSKFPVVTQAVNQYFSDNRCSGIISFLAIVVGIYVTVWSIFSTSAGKINEELLKKRVEGQLFFLIEVGLFESLAAIFICVFVPSIYIAYADSLLVLVTLALISFVKFVIILLLITKLNIRYIVNEIDSQKRNNTELLVKIDEIYQRVIEKK